MLNWTTQRLTTDPARCTHILVHATPAREELRVCTNVVFRLFGELTRGIIITLNKMTLYYADLRHLNQRCITITKVAAIVALSPKIFISTIGPTLQWADSLDTLPRHHYFTPEKGKEGVRLNGRLSHFIVKLAALDDGAAKEVMLTWRTFSQTAYHLEHLWPVNVMRWIREAFPPSEAAKRITSAFEIGLRCQDATRPFIAGLLLWHATATMRSIEIIRYAADRCLYDTLATFFKTIKEWTNSFKHHTSFLGEDVHELFEFEVLVNRGIASVDWDKEEHNRTHPKLCTLPYAAIREECTKLFKQCLHHGGRHFIASWDDYWQKRAIHVASGSVHSQYLDWPPELLPNGASKANAVALMPSDLPITYFTQRTPCISANASVKAEWGKARAIYGCDLTSYLLTDFAMPTCEEILAPLFPVGSSAAPATVEKFMDVIRTAGVSMCFDYEDFNSQHSFSSMTAVLDAYYDVYHGLMSPEQDIAFKWVRQAQSNQYVTNKQNGTHYTCEGTLLSGNRLTTFINTVLNRVYLTLSARECITTSIHNGDDALTYSPNMYEALAILRRVKAQHIRAQPSKCFIAGIQEFLRVDRAARSGRGRQYLARACATATQGRNESRQVRGIIDYVNTNKERVEELFERSGLPTSTTAKLRAAIAAHFRRRATRVFPDQAELLSTAERTHNVFGGLNDTEGVTERTVLHCTHRLVHNVDKTGLIRASKHGIHDAASYIVKKLRIDTPEAFQHARHSVTTTLLAQCYDTKNEYDVMSLPANVKPDIVAAHVRLMRQEVRHDRLLGLARMSGLDALLAQVEWHPAISFILNDRSFDFNQWMTYFF